LSESSTIARLLLGPDQMPIARQRDRSGQVIPVEVEPSEIDATDFPVVVLINSETSGGGELVAAALQDYKRALIAGQKSVGKSSVQRSLERVGIPFKVTTGVLIRPRNKDPQAAEIPADDWPVCPDPGRELPATAELNRQLKTWYTLHALRPAGSVEALPLDDPDNDPQRQAAVQMLKKGMNRGVH
jgi:C-terminal processing protease CtpA/Prc